MLWPQLQHSISNCVLNKLYKFSYYYHKFLVCLPLRSYRIVGKWLFIAGKEITFNRDLWFNGQQIKLSCGKMVKGLSGKLSDKKITFCLNFVQRGRGIMPESKLFKELFFCSCFYKKIGRGGVVWFQLFFELFCLSLDMFQEGEGGLSDSKLVEELFCLWAVQLLQN